MLLWVHPFCVQPKRACLWLKSLWQPCTSDMSKFSKNCISSFTQVLDCTFFFSFPPQQLNLPLVLLQPLHVPSVAIVGWCGENGLSPTSDCSENLNYDLLGEGGNPAVLVTMSLSLGNIAGLWRNFPVPCVYFPSYALLILLFRSNLVSPSFFSLFFFPPIFLFTFLSGL